ncbi:SdpI family protein [Paenibacillus allorhizosphaerae]|uniref:Immunity protein SdpI n=1 Tax=Paenibacillus allorhizosphaerae TaxID=2849866 RepID=A0ABN7TPK3_9BACL|nr:SdpI family protein [Paenibacillus allorhizosphaerae]CAG7644796.1 Immunity protein SdpI [Paenibacillus allorhizosphaerae]
MKVMREIVLILLSISPAFGALLFYNQLPETMATHFGVDNEVNGTMSRGALIITLILLGLLPVLMRVARYVDPKRANYRQFSKAFEVSRVGVTILLTVIGWMIIAYNLGNHVDMTKVVMFVIGLFFAIMGNYLTQVKHNYMFGIRTPWTLANEEIWRKTHRLAGPLMMIGGVTSLITLFFSGLAAVLVFLIVILIASIIPVFYSYMLYKRNRTK